MAALLMLAVAFAVKDVIGGNNYQINAPYDAYMRVLAASRLILIAIAALVAFKSKFGKSEALLFWGILGLSLDVFWQYIPPGPLFWFSAALAHAAIGFGMAQLVRYAAEDHPSERFRRRVTVWAAAIGVTIGVAGFAPVALFYGSIGGRALDDATFALIAPWLDRLRWLWMLAACVAIEGCAAAALRTATAQRRAHALLVVASFAPLALATSVHAIVRIAGAHDIAAARDIDAIGNVLTAAGLAYGALTRRLVDVEFYVSAALAAAIAGAALTILGFSSEHFFVPWLGSYVESLPVLAHYAPAVRIGAHVLTAFAAYLVLTKVYDDAGPLVRNAIFHHREEHLRALRALGESIASMPAAQVAPALMEATIKYADAAFAAIYRRESSGFRRSDGSGEPLPPVHVAGSDERVPTSLTAHAAGDGSAAFAMSTGPRISGFLLAGPKRDATAYAPDELRALGLAAREARIALAVGAEGQPGSTPHLP